MFSIKQIIDKKKESVVNYKNITGDKPDGYRTVAYMKMKALVDAFPSDLSLLEKEITENSRWGDIEKLPDGINRGQVLLRGEHNERIDGVRYNVSVVIYEKSGVPYKAHLFGVVSNCETCYVRDILGEFDKSDGNEKITYKIAKRKLG
jgi:hypothetical protein